jgi:hypothetical protein
MIDPATAGLELECWTLGFPPLAALRLKKGSQRLPLQFLIVGEAVSFPSRYG